MKTLYIAELKKLLSLRILILLAVLTALTVWRTGDRGIQHVTDLFDDPAYAAVYAETRGEMTAEKVQRIISARNVYLEKIGTADISPELVACYQIYEPLKYQYDYAAEMQKYLETAENAADYYRKNGNTTDAARAEYYRNIYAGRYLQEYYNTDDFADYHAQNFASLCCYFLILAVLLPMFTGEHTGKTQALLLTASPGMKKALPTKLLAALTAVFCVCLWLHLAEFFAVLPRYHLDGWNHPLYGTQSLQFITLGCTNLEMVFLRLLMRLLTGWIWALTVLLISSVCRKMLTAASLSLTAFGILLAGTEHFQTLVNPFYAVQVLRISKSFDCISICGKMYIPLTVAVMFQLAMQMILLILICITGLKRRCAA